MYSSLFYQSKGTINNQLSNRMLHKFSNRLQAHERQVPEGFRVLNCIHWLFSSNAVSSVIVY